MGAWTAKRSPPATAFRWEPLQHKPAWQRPPNPGVHSSLAPIRPQVTAFRRRSTADRRWLVGMHRDQPEHVQQLPQIIRVVGVAGHHHPRAPELVVGNAIRVGRAALLWDRPWRGATLFPDVPPRTVDTAQPVPPHRCSPSVLAPGPAETPPPGPHRCGVNTPIGMSRGHPRDRDRHVTYRPRPPQPSSRVRVAHSGDRADTGEPPSAGKARFQLGVRSRATGLYRRRRSSKSIHPGGVVCPLRHRSARRSPSPV